MLYIEITEKKHERLARTQFIKSIIIKKILTMQKYAIVADENYLQGKLFQIKIAIYI